MWYTLNLHDVICHLECSNSGKINLSLNWLKCNTMTRENTFKFPLLEIMATLWKMLFLRMSALLVVPGDVAVRGPSFISLSSRRSGCCYHRSVCMLDCSVGSTDLCPCNVWIVLQIRGWLGKGPCGLELILFSTIEFGIWRSNQFELFTSIISLSMEWFGFKSHGSKFARGLGL